MNEAGKAELKSMDVAEDKRRQLAQMFPEAVTETRTADGELVRAVDFERLKAVLGTFSEILENQKERYGMTWPGKNECLKIIQQPSIAALKPCRKESVNFDTTENLFIEGDNLEVLKLLQKAYYGKVKMIYIDPPYNTGKEFIYPDKYAENLDTYLAYTGQVDAQGRKFSTNPEDSGRYHSAWLNMMLPRLYLAWNLLRDDGVIFISIDHHEAHNLRALCDDFFGEESFRASIVWRRTVSGAISGQGFVVAHDTLLCYSRSPDTPLGRLAVSDESNYKNPDNDPRGPYKLQKLERTLEGDRPSMTFEIESPAGAITRTWATSPLKYRALLADNRIAFSKTGIPYYKQFLSEYKGRLPDTWWDDVGGYNQDASREIKELFEAKDIFTNPKPTVLLKVMMEIGASNDATVLDFFSGSCTTAHAVLGLNKQDGGSRKFIMVQLPEPCDEKSEAFKAGFKTIADIGKERIRRAIKKLNAENAGELGLESEKKPDRGFRVYKLARSNFKVWDSERAAVAPDAIAKQLELHEQHVDSKAGAEDLLYELLLKAGFPLTTKVEKVTLAGKNVFSVADGALLICLEREITKKLVKAMADAEPQQVICLDEGFKGNDQLKANAVQTFKARGQGKESATVFRTV